MKKVFFLLAFAAIFAFGFSSCRKCETCTATNRVTGLTEDTQEYCGSKTTVDLNTSTYESIWNDSYTYASCN